MSKQIHLTKGQVALIDAADYDQLIQLHWLYSPHGYAMRTMTKNKRRYFIQMHSEIMNAQPGELVDHIDRDRLNNTRANLRIVDRRQNMWNRNPNKRSAIAYKGVSKHIRGWHARIRVYGQRIHLGYFDDPKMAAQVYDAAALRFFGEYAHINFPDRLPSPAALAQVEDILKRREDSLG
jgi:hypothetical protein